MLFVFSFYSQTCVFNFNIKVIISNRNQMLNMALLGVLYGIRLQSKNYLGQPSRISCNLLLVFKSIELIFEFDSLIICFVLLHFDHIVDKFYYVKTRDIFPKLISVYLRVVKQILNVEWHQLAALLLNLLAFYQLFHYWTYLRF